VTIPASAGQSEPPCRGLALTTNLAADVVPGACTAAMMGGLDRYIMGLERAAVPAGDRKDGVNS
jgi:hypothetical protein